MQQASHTRERERREGGQSIMAPPPPPPDATTAAQQKGGGGDKPTSISSGAKQQAPPKRHADYRTSGGANLLEKPLYPPRKASEEFLFPLHNDPSRQSPLIVAIFNILATIVGAGVLSLPYAMSKTGWVLGLAMLVLSALASDFTLYILCSASRRTGVPSYTALARFCYGGRFEGFILAMMLAFLLLCLTAFMMLLTDTVSSLIEYIAGIGTLSHHRREMVLAGCVWLVLPLCFFRSLHALRYTCYLGFVSVVVLTMSVAYRSANTIMQDPGRIAQIRAFPEHWTDPLLVFPIFVLAFICSFNILPVHSSLVDPTRDRIKIVIHSSMLCTLAIYVVISLAGYFYALDDTKDDILSNFPSDDGLLLVGRVGLSATLFFAIPIIVLPTRQAALDLAAKAFRFLDTHLCGGLATSIEGGASSSSERQPLVGGINNGGGGGGRGGPRVATLSTWQPGGGAAGRGGGGGGDVEAGGRRLGGTSSSSGSSGGGGLTQAEEGFLDTIKVCVSTLLIVGAAAELAGQVPGVAFVWSLCGSSMGFFLGFTLPAIFYLKIRHRKRHMWNKGLSWLTLVVSVASIIMCTTVTIYTLYTHHSSTTSNSSSSASSPPAVIPRPPPPSSPAAAAAGGEDTTRRWLLLQWW